MDLCVDPTPRPPLPGLRAKYTRRPFEQGRGRTGLLPFRFREGAAGQACGVNPTAHKLYQRFARSYSTAYPLTPPIVSPPVM